MYNKFTALGFIFLCLHFYSLFLRETVAKNSKEGTFSLLTSLKTAISINLTLYGFASVISNEEIM